MTAPVHEAAGPPTQERVWQLLSGQITDPHRLLGRHPCAEGTAVTVLARGADAVDVELGDGRRIPLGRLHPDGLFRAVVPGGAGFYTVWERTDGRWRQRQDPYQWPPVLDEDGLALFAAGRHTRLWELLGARPQPASNGTPAGTLFAVWAPNARGVQVTGDFNGWDGRGHLMSRTGTGGVWALFVPGVGAGARYRFVVCGADGRWREKADPLARAAECPPANASVVTATSYSWRDTGWMRERPARQSAGRPMSVYEVHLPSWRRREDGSWLDYRDLARLLGEHVQRLGFTHVQLLPLAEHPLTASWGYQVGSYFAPTARHGDPDGLRFLVDHLHGLGVGVLFDFVPAHFPRDAWCLGTFDGTALYEHPDPRRGEHPDWGTYIFDYARPEVRSFLLSAASYWLAEFHADGLRVDAVSSMLYLDYSRGEGEWLPNALGGRENLEAVELLRELTTGVHTAHPGALVIAEESSAWPGVTRPEGLGFDLKWNLGWMHDTLLQTGSAHPDGDGFRHSASYAFSERFLLPLSHDEVVHGKGSLWQRMPGDDGAKAERLRALFAYMWAYPGKKLLFMGGEFGQTSEWDAEGELPWSQAATERGAALTALVTRLNRLQRSLAPLHVDDDPRLFSWLPEPNGEQVAAFARGGAGGETLVCLVNLSDQPVTALGVPLPAPNGWSVVLDTTASPDGTPVAELVRADGAPLGLPARSALWLWHDGRREDAPR
ncbi:1,4-alpha-glucan branching protein GlgB [Streptomyces sp. WELS2]|uniref:1,4-alpha-glucan branching protein GlgB n=1 Tax=Streptomyces sp. WELS2 TaxID=2749435 RepID=UPI0015F00BB3|nr:1,4-alpha-glucan branching protein GlgB [Streptomyces sp. WELS2]